jgi:hypothetical protein
LEKHGATLENVDKVTTYVTDILYFFEAGKCRSEIYSGITPPVGTFLVVTALAWPGMLIEVDVWVVLMTTDAPDGPYDLSTCPAESTSADVLPHGSWALRCRGVAAGRSVKTGLRTGGTGVIGSIVLMTTDAPDGPYDLSPCPTESTSADVLPRARDVAVEALAVLIRLRDPFAQVPPVGRILVLSCRQVGRSHFRRGFHR